MADSHNTTTDIRLLNLERELDAIETRIRRCPHADQERLAEECLVLEQEIGDAPAQTLEGVGVKLRRTLTMIREGRGDLTDSPVRSALAAVDRLKDEPALADLRAGQIEIAHELRNARSGINVIADGVRELLRERGGVGG